MVATVVTLPRTLVQGAPVAPKEMALMEATVAGLPVALDIEAVAADFVHVMAMPLTLRTMFPVFVAETGTGDGAGLTVQTVEGTAMAGVTARARAAVAAPATTAVFLMVFFMALGLSLGIDQRRTATSEGGERPAARVSPAAKPDVTCGKLS
ncbi:hypothetical protein GCM10010497_25490 [Streptomyces cinereoruber]|uniref:ABC transmembrane type-1 domain-containing protein n=1 Tax=Streptomyces cinereoruber TaxID=67260 RepID=A0AAV4KIP5_9ACTN|nr:hypothetical protein GCM10010497_25490 [Streptomyces cinereoruber]